VGVRPAIAIGGGTWLVSHLHYLLKAAPAESRALCQQETRLTIFDNCREKLGKCLALASLP
jgi:hypothetical protein